MSALEDRSFLNKQDNSSFIANYLKSLSRFPLLNKEKELYLGRMMLEQKKKLKQIEKQFENGQIGQSEYDSSKKNCQTKIDRCKHRLILCNLRLVVYIAKRFHPKNMNILEVINEGNIGLIEAVDRFDPRHGCKFSTYGSWWIQQAVTKAIADKGRTIRVPIHVVNTAKKLRNVQSLLTQEYGREANFRQIANYNQIPYKKVEQIMAGADVPSSLDIVIDEENMTTLGELIPSDSYVEPYQQLLQKNKEKAVIAAVTNLPYREKLVLSYRFGLFDKPKKTLKEIGVILNITRERVRQIQKKALLSLKKNSSVNSYFQN